MEKFLNKFKYELKKKKKLNLHANVKKIYKKLANSSF